MDLYDKVMTSLFGPLVPMEAYIVSSIGILVGIGLIIVAIATVVIMRERKKINYGKE